MVIEIVFLEGSSMSVSDWISLMSLAIALGAVVFAFIDRVGRNAKKSYAAERDFEHLKRHNEQLQQNVIAIIGEIEENSHQLMELKMRIDYWLEHSSKGGDNG